MMVGSGERDEDVHSKLILTKIKECYDSPTFSDIKVISSNRIFNAHKIILNTRSGGWGVKDQQIIDNTSIKAYPQN